MDYYDHSNINPKTILYDDACHLKKYVTNKSSMKFNLSTNRGKNLASKNICVDRFHFTSHVDSWCQLNYDPNKMEELKDVNTSVTEETNYWFGRFKFIFKHMNYERYHFLLYTLSDEFNKFRLLEKKYELVRKINGPSSK